MPSGSWVTGHNFILHVFINKGVGHKDYDYVADKKFPTENKSYNYFNPMWKGQKVQM